MKTAKRDRTLDQQLARGPIDLPFLMLVVLLTVIGVIMVFSASYATAIKEAKNPANYFIRQAIFAVLGLAIMYIASWFNYRLYKKLAVLVLLVSLALLVLVLIPGFHTVRTDNVKRWLKAIGPIPSFQPSEAAKLGVILFCAARMSRRDGEKKRRFNTKELSGRILQFFENIGFFELVPYIAVLGVIMILMYLEPHMSGMILILVAAASILFAGGIKMGWFALGGAGVVGLIALMISSKDYQAGRIAVWRDPWAYPQNGGYQIIQSLYAIGSGGLFGVGFGQSRQKQLFLPEPENDYIFSIVCEELGLVGAGLILLLFALLIIRGYWIALHARDRFGSLVVVGIITLLAVQVFLNIGVVTNLLPPTGVSLPFFSYGGTALVIQLAEMGIVLGVSRQIPAPKQG